jgi:hypothetical protein
MSLIGTNVIVTSISKTLRNLPSLLRLTWARKIDICIGFGSGNIHLARYISRAADAAVADAYGWPADLPDDEILTRLVALNLERADEERRGIIRWLRPDFQNPTGQQQTALDVGQAVPDTPTKKPATLKKQPWPKSLSEQAAAVQAALVAMSGTASAIDIAKCFGRATESRVDRIEELLETLATLGKARELADGRYVAM